MKVESKGRRGRRRGGDTPSARPSARQTDYSQLDNPFPPVKAISDDQVEALHNTSLRVLEELGIKVLLPAAREVYQQAGARVDGEMVYIGPELVDEALRTAPKSIHLRGGIPKRDIHLQPGRMAMQCAGGCPNATDLIRGRRPGSLRDFDELLMMCQHYDVLNFIPPIVEPQDVASNERHYAWMNSQLTLTDKVPFVFSRGTPQVMDSFAMMRLARGLSADEFKQAPYCYTVINTNSPRQIDIPMGQGLMDFAEHGQMSIITPFTLMGAMAPITPAGAMTLSHAETLGALVLTQLVRPGAPVCYGTFTSNVDMKSGSPALGTPEQFKANLIAGQLARHVGLPWRSASGSAAAVADVQAAHETQMGTWGTVLAGANVVMHAAGWLESGLSVSYEKFITDVEMLQIMAEIFTPTGGTDADLAFDAIKEVEPGGHFFACQHTMERFQTEFYEPIVYDWSNYGTWVERGEQTATERATGIWQAIVSAGPQVQLPADLQEQMDAFVAKRKAEGGAEPES